MAKAYRERMSKEQDRIEDLEEGMRLIATLVQRDGRHEVTERDEAILVVALDRLGLDEPPMPFWRHP